MPKIPKDFSMDLALCLFRYFPYGGLQRDFLKVAHLAIEKGHHVTCYTMQWEGEKPEGLIIHTIKTNAFTNHGRCFDFAMKLKKILKKAKHDCVLGFNRLPGMDFYFGADVCFQAAAREKHPILSYFLPRYQTFIALEKMVFNPLSKTQILLLNEAEKAAYQYYYQTQEDRFHFIPPGIRVPETLPSKEEARKKLRLPIPLDAYWLLFVGTHLQLKGLDRVLNALAQFSSHRKTYLLVIGTKGQQAFKKQAEKMDLEKQVIFLGAVDDVYPYMQAADVLTHPAYQEAAGMVLVEALANGLPVITTSNCGYASHILASRAGYVVSGKPFDEKAFEKALALVELSEQPPNECLRQHALAYVKRAELSQMAERILRLCEEHFSNPKSNGFPSCVV